MDSRTAFSMCQPEVSSLTPRSVQNRSKSILKRYRSVPSDGFHRFRFFDDPGIALTLLFRDVTSASIASRADQCMRDIKLLIFDTDVSCVTRCVTSCVTRRVTSLVTRFVTSLVTRFVTSLVTRFVTSLVTRFVTSLVTRSVLFFSSAASSSSNSGRISSFNASHMT